MHHNTTFLHKKSDFFRKNGHSFIIFRNKEGYMFIMYWLYYVFLGNIIIIIHFISLFLILKEESFSGEL